MPSASYRPHNPGHDYYDAGAYLITLVVGERERCLSVLGSDIGHPSVSLLPTGAIVAEEWEKTAAIQRSKGRNIRTIAQVCMPDHWHGVIVVEERMDISLGAIINAFKSVCTSRWRKEVTCYVQPPCTATLIRHMNKERRRTYYATRPRIERPLFDDDYDDTICIDEAHLRRMVTYVNDNPRRAIVMRHFPQFMQRCLHVIIDGVDYAAFGNLFLLRWAHKEQVFCHRRDPATGVPYETTAAFRHEHDAWIEKVMAGATVIVTPGISKGEQIMKKECLEKGFPLIHIQKEAIGPLWKPELSRFEACRNGTLLILAPWNGGLMEDVNGVPADSDYSRFHNLNTLARSICDFDGEARVVMK